MRRRGTTGLAWLVGLAALTGLVLADGPGVVLHGLAESPVERVEVIHASQVLEDGSAGEEPGGEADTAGAVGGDEADGFCARSLLHGEA